MQLVFIDNGRLITDSLTVAEVFFKDHKNVIRDIEVQIEKLNEAGESEWGVLNFEQTHYQHPQNKQLYPKINMTEDAFALVAMSYVTPEAMKMKIRFLDEFKRMRESLNEPKILTPTELIAAMANQAVELERKQAEQARRLTAVEKRMDDAVEIIGLNVVDGRKKVTAILNRIAQSLGGGSSYHDIRADSYKRLESRAECNLTIRQSNKRKKMALEGAPKSKISQVTKLDVIFDDARLTEIYFAIVKEMAIQNRVDPEGIAS